MNEEQPTPPASRWSLWRYDRRTRRMIVLSIVLGLAAVAVVTRSVIVIRQGRGTTEARRQTDQEQRLPDFVVAAVRPLPSQEVRAADRELAPTRSVKPGHWVSIAQEMRANNFDFLGELEAGFLANKAPVELDRTAFRLSVARQVSLAKGQTRVLEWTMLVPQPEVREGDPRSLPEEAAVPFEVESRIRYRRGGAEPVRRSTPLRTMPSWQYHLVVLAQRPGEYNWLLRLPSMQLEQERDEVEPFETISEHLVDPVDSMYLVVRPTRGRPPLAYPLPPTPLAWTSTACVLWDDINPEDLTPEQREAMLVWLHWGGELIVSGPGSLGTLKGSFLDPYLPAGAGDSVQLEVERLAALNERWALPGLNPARVIDPGPGVVLQLHEGGDFVPQTGELVAERRVGRGRIVVTAFRLPPAVRLSRDETYWRSYDRFFQECLLDGPYVESPLGEPPRSAVADATDVAPRLRNFRGEPPVVTNVWLFSRDAYRPWLDKAQPRITGDQDIEEVTRQRPEHESPSLGAWSGFSAVSNEAREALRRAAGISVPRADFVLWVVGVYLVVLVPLNFSVFWLIGRVEWAWLAAPLIAIVCAVVVVRQAQLDIGFVRSRTEVAVLEMQPGFPRAHATRYAALYTSLSTPYEVRLDDPNGVVLPLAKSHDFRRLVGQQITPLELRRLASETSLRGYFVNSNSTDLLHCEHMADLGGTIELSRRADGTQRVVNGTTLDLQEAAVVRRTADGRIEGAWLGALAAGESARLEFRELAAGDLAGWHQAARVGHDAATPLDLRGLIRIAQDARQLQQGDGERGTGREAGLASMIELVDFTKRYGDFLAVDRLNLRIDTGEIFGFIGPNGAGKSTTMRFLVTLLRATSGEGTVNGFSVTRDPMNVRRSVGYMPDNFGVYDGMRVWEFLDFFAVAYQVPRSRRKQVIADVLELLDLVHKRDDYVNGLSRGMKQRLCLAKTLVHDPPVLILDEPSSGLDPRARLEMKALLKELRRMGKTILISSHILTELADCCTSIGIIERGQLLMHGPIDDVYRRIRGNRTIEIRFVDNMDVGLSVIRSLPQTRQVQVYDHRATVELAAQDDGELAALLEKLLAEGVRIRSFAERDPSLEDVFMMVTKGLVS